MSGEAMDIDTSASKGKGKAREGSSLQNQVGAVNAPFVEKYRPQSLDDIASHDHIVTTISRLIDTDRLPHMLFYGPPGTGKTSTVLAIARRLYGPKYSTMVLELNASDDRGIGVVRDKIKTFASTRKMFDTGVKLIILDEADAMTGAAQAALRRVIEKYTKNTRFCLIGNYVGKIIPALQSRCTRFRFAPLKKELVVERVRMIIKTEGINVTEDGLEALLTLANGDMRKILNILQSTAMAFDKVDEAAIYTCTGNPMPADIKNVLHWMLNEPYADALKKIQALQTDKGLAVQDILKEIHALTVKVELPPKVKMMICRELGELEHRLVFGTSERLQLGAMVGVYQMARPLISDAMQA